MCSFFLLLFFPRFLFYNPKLYLFFFITALLTDRNASLYTSFCTAAFVNMMTITLETLDWLMKNIWSGNKVWRSGMRGGGKNVCLSACLVRNASLWPFWYHVFSSLPLPPATSRLEVVCTYARLQLPHPQPRPFITLHLKSLPLSALMRNRKQEHRRKEKKKIQSRWK